MECVIKTENLTKVFHAGFLRKKETLAVSELNLEVKPGEIFAFLGPNGAGKTTTIKMLLSLLYPTRGKAYLFEKDLKDARLRGKVGFLPESPAFYDYLTLTEFLKLNGGLYAMKSSRLKMRVSELITLVELTHVKDVQLRKFSRGMIQRAGVAQALLNDPELVILDEPTSGLDPIGRKKILSLIKEFKKLGKTIFFSTHILPDVEAVADTVAIINQGKLLKVGNIETLLAANGEVEIVAQNLKTQAIEQIKKQNVKVVEVAKAIHIYLSPHTPIWWILELIKTSEGTLIKVEKRRKSLEEVFIKYLETKVESSE